MATSPAYCHRGRENDRDPDVGFSITLRACLFLRTAPPHIEFAEPGHVSLDREHRTTERRPAPARRRPSLERKPTPDVSERSTCDAARPGESVVGKRIWERVRMRALAEASPVFGAVYWGETVTIDGDDTRSIQSAVIVRSMVMANFPEHEIRSVMAYRYPIIRPGSARWRDDIERMIAKYVARFADRYDPSPTCFPSGERAPKEKRPTSYERYVEAFLADPGLSDDEMAQRLGISRSMVGANRRRLLAERPDLIDVRKAALKQKSGFAALARALAETPDADDAALAQKTGLAESTVRVYRRTIRRRARPARRASAPQRKKTSSRAPGTQTRAVARTSPPSPFLHNRTAPERVSPGFPADNASTPDGDLPASATRRSLRWEDCRSRPWETRRRRSIIGLRRRSASGRGVILLLRSTVRRREH